MRKRKKKHIHTQTQIFIAIEESHSIGTIVGYIETVYFEVVSHDVHDTLLLTRHPTVGVHHFFFFFFPGVSSVLGGLRHDDPPDY